MSDDESGLLAAIEAAPGDDAPRLVYADWCDENGREGFAWQIRQSLARPRGLVEIAEMFGSNSRHEGAGAVSAERRYLVLWRGNGEPDQSAAFAEVMRHAPYAMCGLPFCLMIADIRQGGDRPVAWTVKVSYVRPRANAPPTVSPAPGRGVMVAIGTDVVVQPSDVMVWDHAR